MALVPVGEAAGGSTAARSVAGALAPFYGDLAVVAADFEGHPETGFLCMLRFSNGHTHEQRFY